jgi:hypothetical protein
MIIMMGLDPASQIIRADPMRTNRNLTRANNYGDVFLVKPISDELFRLAIEDWNIFPIKAFDRQPACSGSREIEAG